MNNFLVIAYSIGAALFFTAWLKFFKKDNNLSNKEQQLSWIILLVATVFWPIVVPISYLELLSAKTRVPSHWSR